MAIIALEGMHFFAHHGVFESEKLSGNTFEVDVWVDTGKEPLPNTDELSDALDYGQIYEIVEKAMQERSDLLETLVLRIGKECLACFRKVNSIRVRVSKFNPPVAGRAHRSYVEDVFER